jgi:4-diphosphocytidyl-2-C-methyl-D-erythritol kinase
LASVDLPTPWYLVLVPPCHVSTAAVFNHPELTRDSSPITLADFVRGDARNDCLATVLATYPEVRGAYDWLAQHSEAPRLTGTGACLFAALSSRDEARRLLAQVPPGLPAFVARGCNGSPLFGGTDSTR